MGKSFPALLVFASAMALAHSSAAEPAWCKDPRLKDAEQAICDNSKLGTLDAELNVAYFSLYKRRRGREKKALGSIQGRWLRNKRNACGYNIGCLKDVIASRIDELKRRQ